MLAAELNTYGKNLVPAAKTAPHDGVKLQATAKAHLTPRQPQLPPPQALVHAVADSPTGQSPTAKPVQPKIIETKNVTMKVGSVLDPLALWQTKPDPKQVVGCREGCHPDVQANSDAGEDFFEVWFAAAHREAPYVEEADARSSIVDQILPSLSFGNEQH